MAHSSASHVASDFENIEQYLPTPSGTRLGSGAPGPEYWQQRVDYKIKADIDEFNKRLYGQQQITYTNNSPHTLTYLWIQLDQNRFNADSLSYLSRPSPLSGGDSVSSQSLQSWRTLQDFQGGFNLTRIADATSGARLSYTVVDTNARIDLLSPLQPGQSVTIAVDWWFNIVPHDDIGGRSGYQSFEDGNDIFQLAQWYPRLAAYTDYQGWQNKPFLGRSEFALEFGDYDVEITVPRGMVVASTGTLQNAETVLTRDQRSRWQRAQRSPTPEYIINVTEAEANQQKRLDGTVTWQYKALSVRDFAFATSRKFIWDAMGVELPTGWVTAMSYYPTESKALWSKYSTEAVAHTLRSYSKRSFDYPYPVAISVNGPVRAMEYPMISFNAPKSYADGSYFEVPLDDNRDSWLHAKSSLISIVIHEVGHNYFPMIVNSDERNWTWLDEGINTYLQFLAEAEWDANYPSRRGPADSLSKYLQDKHSVPIMRDGDVLLQVGNNAYAKPATALNVLRELVLGRELFDFALREYSQRWKFKRPTPADFFRTMEDASGKDLDWFWRHWFYSTNHVDVAIESVTRRHIGADDPEVKAYLAEYKERVQGPSLFHLRNEGETTATERNPALADFYSKRSAKSSNNEERKEYQESLKSLKDYERKLLKDSALYYEIKFTNEGRLPSPLPLRVTVEKGQPIEFTVPAEVWRLATDYELHYLLTTESPIVKVEFDPYRASGDVDVGNNHYPAEIGEDAFELIPAEDAPDNPIRKARKK